MKHHSFCETRVLVVTNSKLGDSTITRSYYFLKPSFLKVRVLQCVILVIIAFMSIEMNSQTAQVWEAFEPFDALNIDGVECRTWPSSIEPGIN
jgi:hypothetical protein